MELLIKGCECNQQVSQLKALQENPCDQSISYPNLLIIPLGNSPVIANVIALWFKHCKEFQREGAQPFLAASFSIFPMEMALHNGGTASENVHLQKCLIISPHAPNLGLIFFRNKDKRSHGTFYEHHCWYEWFPEFTNVGILHTSSTTPPKNELRGGNTLHSLAIKSKPSRVSFNTPTWLGVFYG